MVSREDARFAHRQPGWAAWCWSWGWCCSWSTRSIPPAPAAITTALQTLASQDAAERSRKGPGGSSASDPRDLLAAKAMRRVSDDASHPSAVSSTDPGVITLPAPTATGPAQVPTGFPHTPAGAMAQLAAIDQTAFESGSLTQVRAVIEGWAVRGGPTVSNWSLISGMADLFNQMGVAGSGASDVSAQLALVLTPLMGQIKGSVGPDFTIPCVDFELDVTLQQTARGADADCQRMVWQRAPAGSTQYGKAVGRWVDRRRLRASHRPVGLAGHRSGHRCRLPRPTTGAPPMSRDRIEAIDLNPLHWLGDAATAAVGNVWKAAMTGLWSAALWMLKLAFRIIDAFTTPDLSAAGPMGAVLPTTLWLGAALAVIMMFVQLTLALVRRDGKSMGQILLGIGQFGLVWVGFLGLAGGFVAAAAGLEHGILSGMLHASDMSHVDLSTTFPDNIGDITLATVLGILGLLIVIPAAFFYVLIMFVREAALIILVATAPISAAGLVSETGKVWFWKTLRWFFSCLLISPVAALLLGIGVKLSVGVIDPPPTTAEVMKMCKANPDKCNPLKGAPGLSAAANASATAHAGMAVVGCIIIAIGAVCPMILFRLLAFVEPGTASGAALRQSWSDAGGMSGLLSGSGGKTSAGSGAATQSSGDGRSGGESGAESQTQSRLTQALGSFGAGVGAVSSVAQRAVDIGSDILGQAGVGSPSYSMTPTDERSSRRSVGGRGGNATDDTSDDAGTGDTGSGRDTGSGGGDGRGGGNLPEPPHPPMPGGPGGGGGGLPTPGGAGGAGEGGGGAEAAAVVAV